MAVFWSQPWQSNTSYVQTYTCGTASTTWPTQPAPEVKPRTHLDWLREQVEEICLLARPEAL